MLYQLIPTPSSSIIRGTTHVSLVLISSSAADLCALIPALGILASSSRSIEASSSSSETNFSSTKWLVIVFLTCVFSGG